MKKYLNKNKLYADYIGKDGKWFDAGSVENYHNTNLFVSNMENKKGIRIACLEKIALKNKWINKKNILSAIKFYGNCNYSNYLKKLI